MIEALEDRQLLAVSVVELPIGNQAGTVNAIAVGLDGDIWYSESLSAGGNVLGRINPATGAVKAEYPVTSGSLVVPDLVAGPDNRIWFTDSAGKIGRLDPLTGTVTEFGLQSPLDSPDQITVGPDHNLWFTINTTGKIGRITTGGVVDEFALSSSQAAPGEIFSDGVGTLWFSITINGNEGRIGKIATAGQVTEFPAPVGQSGSSGIAFGPDGFLWVTDSSANRIDRINPTTGAVTGQFTPPTANSLPYGMTLGPNQTLYFTERGGNQIGGFNAFNPTIFTEFAVPTPGAAPYRIVTGADGNLWFTEFNRPAIGVVVLSGRGPNGSTVMPGTGPGASIAPRLVAAGPLIQSVPVRGSQKGRPRARSQFAGFTLTFSEALNPIRAGDAGNYQVLTVSRRGRKTLTRPIGFRVSYNQTTSVVSLVLQGKAKFPKGGQIVVNASSPSGIADTTGDFLTGPNVLTIGRNARTVTF